MKLEFVKSDRRIAKMSESPVIQKYHDFPSSSSGIKKYAFHLLDIAVARISLSDLVSSN